MSSKKKSAKKSTTSSSTSVVQHLFQEVSGWVDPDLDVKEKVQSLKTLQPYTEEVDGYFSFTSQHDGEVEGQWPVLEWNTHFRKAYGLLLWVRPVLGKNEIETTILEDDAAATSSHRRVLYRLASSPDDTEATGVCVTIGDWRVVDPAPSDENSNQPEEHRRVLTNLMAFSLPSGSIHESFNSQSFQASSYVSAPLELRENEWSLLGITHVFPYLKRPHWTVCVNGKVAASGELNYPVLERTPVLNFNTFLQDVAKGGCQYIHNDTKPDFKKKASDLQNQVWPRREFRFHVASFCLCSDSISPTLQALLSQAGPNMSLATGGCIPRLPPVANWSKGSSLEGPNVGIPLVVHGQALAIQKLTGSCILWASAVESSLLASNSKVQRIICKMLTQRGTTHTAPRVGLIEPTPPFATGGAGEEEEEEHSISWTLLGPSCSIHHTLSNYLLRETDSKTLSKSDNATHTTKLWSVLFLEGGNQALDAHMLLPFFLALPPPGTMMDLQVKLSTDSLQHLFDLYSNDAQFACHLLKLLAVSIRSGGGRWQEMLLQNGTFHMLGCNLRRSLVRADYLKVHQYKTYSEFIKAHSPAKFQTTMAFLPTTPSSVPKSIALAMADLIDACCGPAGPYLEDLVPSQQIQRTSDLALTALFGLGLDWDLWGGDWTAASIILKTVAKRYGGYCVTAGYILRSQISVQYFLDTLKQPFMMVSSQVAGNTPEMLTEIGYACSQILQAMLLSSLSNTRTVSQAEHDIAACIGALSDCPLGSMGAYVIFRAIVGVLNWCDILPSKQATHHKQIDDDHKCQVASRLGRNLMLAQFHDVVAPMLLSRTVFSGEQTMSADRGSKALLLAWGDPWRLGLLIFTWVTTIGGPDGLIASRSLGSLLLASGLAGSLKHAMLDADKTFVSNLFLPPPTMALTIAASSRKFTEWSYTDLLSDRLQIMMPLLPGLIVSLISHPSDVTEETKFPATSLQVLTEMITAMGGAVYRVYGGQTHSAGVKKGRKAKKQQQVLDTGVVKAAKSYIPFMLQVAMLLEFHISVRNVEPENSSGVPILKVPSMVQQGAEDGSWVEVSSTINESYLSDGSVKLPDGVEPSSVEGGLVYLRACQQSILGTLTDLLGNAMRCGGGEASTLLWRSVLSALEETKSFSGGNYDWKAANPLHGFLCRFAAIVLNKALKRDYQWEVWSAELSSAVSRLCLLIEEKELLLTPLGPNRTFTDDQTLLLCTILNILKYGRDTTGWCQLILPSPPDQGEKDSDETQSDRASGDASPGASKLLLPVLQPCLRVVVGCVGNLSSAALIRIPKTPKDGSTTEDTTGLLHHVIVELQATITAAVVGMAFANARDSALLTMASLRRAMKNYKNDDDEDSLSFCNSLFGLVADELKERYEGEKRRRETALFDAYEGTEDERKDGEDAAASAQVVESMLLGGVIGAPSNNEDSTTPEARNGPSVDDITEQVSFDQDDVSLKSSRTKDSKDAPEDFVLFQDGSGERPTKLKFSQYEGLGTALEEHEDKPVDIIDRLTPFLDAWDENAAVEAVESELVELFGDASLHLQGAETAADSMSTFIEFAAAEKQRIQEVTTSFLPNHRYSCISYTERFCWARFNEIAKDGAMIEIWERGIADGNRDIRSRLVTIPCSPQFRRFIPKYLDHSAQNEDGTPPAESEDDIDAFTRSLVESGHLEIVDITKKEVNVEDEPELNLEELGDLDDYAEKPLEMPPDDEEANDGQNNGDTSSETNAMNDSKGDEEAVFDKTKLGSSHYNITASAFASPPDNSSSTMGLIHSAAKGLIEKHLDNCLHIKAEGSRKCALLLTSTHLILEYDVDGEGLYEGEMMAVREEAERQRMIEGAGGNNPNAREGEVIQQEIEKRQREAAALRPKSIRWNLSELSHVYLRRYRLRDSSIELFFIPSGGTSFGGYGLYSPSTSLFLDFGPGYEGNTRRDEAAFAVMKRAPPQAIKQWPDRSGQFLHEQLARLTIGWVEGRITNFDYLLHLNMLAGRSYNDICQYPVMPWVLADYESEEIPDLCDPKNYRDLTKPMGALNPSRLEDFRERFRTFADPSIPPFMYGSHYSTSAGVVLHFLVRLHPYANLHRQLQGGHFDVADRLFSSVPRTWSMCTGSSAAEVKELTPEWYCNPAFLKNSNKFKLGASQDGEVLGDVALPPWANESPELFIEVMRNALESDICSAMLPDWIDLIFGRKQQGPESVKAHNVFFYLTYYGSVDVAAIEDESLRQATELQIAHFGQCPMQLFVRPHVHRVRQINRKRLSFYQVTSAYTHGADRSNDEDATNSERQLNPVFGQPLYLPFFSAPISHWVHLDAPPPGPHADMLCVRLAGSDRCLSVDSQGVFHCFRWAWKSEEGIEVDGTSGNGKFPIDSGCFIAQRELPRFRTLPQLVHRPAPGKKPAVAISKTLFAARSVLLVLSDGDGCGGLAIQLVDPAKGTVRGEAVISSVHTSEITCVSTDPIGTAAGHGGVGGELAIVGSADGCASIWRFMSSHYLPLRPRVRLAGHGGAAIHAVGLSASINVAATVSANLLCLHQIGNGHLIRVIKPPSNALDMPVGQSMVTTFVESPAVAISVQGFVVTVCETKLQASSPTSSSRSVVSLHLFSLEGVSLGSKPLESWRGVPYKMSCTPDGTAVLVCSGRGVTIHRLSAVTPLEFIDEWHVTETDELTSGVARAWDIDLGPSLNRPVVAAAACSNGALRLHALSGISNFSERHKMLGLGQGVGALISTPARRLKNAMGKGLGLGSRVAGVGKEIGQEISSDLKTKGMGGFLGTMFRKNQK